MVFSISTHAEIHHCWARTVLQFSGSSCFFARTGAICSNLALESSHHQDLGFSFLQQDLGFSFLQQDLGFSFLRQVLGFSLLHQVLGFCFLHRDLGFSFLCQDLGFSFLHQNLGFSFLHQVLGFSLFGYYMTPPRNINQMESPKTKKKSNSM